MHLLSIFLFKILYIFAGSASEVAHISPYVGLLFPIPFLIVRTKLMEELLAGEADFEPVVFAIAVYLEAAAVDVSANRVCANQTSTF